MKTYFHRSGAAIATTCITTFIVSTLVVELFGSVEAIATVKRLIAWPGLLILIPALAVTGASGFALGRNRKGRLLDAKKKRMRVIAANGILILLPSAIFLDRWAVTGNFDAQFYFVQVLELLAGSTNLLLIGLNVRDGLRLVGKRPFERSNTPEVTS